MSGKVIEFPKPRHTPRSADRISQERLRRGAELLRQHHALVQALQQFTLEMEISLAEGAEIEQGDLVFDRDLKVVRANRRGSPASVTALPAVR